MIGGIDFVEIEKIIQEESNNVELKKRVDFKDSKSYLQTISAFANGKDIGYIIFGIEESKEIIGIENVKKAYDEISSKIKNSIEPTISPIIDIINIKNKNIILVKVLPGQCTPYYYRDSEGQTAYIRRKKENVAANGIELKELILKGKI